MERGGRERGRLSKREREGERERERERERDRERERKLREHAMLNTVLETMTCRDPHGIRDINQHDRLSEDSNKLVRFLFHRRS